MFAQYDPTMRRFDPVGRARDLERSYRGRYGRRAEALAARLDGDDDEVIIRPWEVRLPRLVILAAARSRGLEPVGGRQSLARRGPWVEDMHFRRRR